MRVNRNFSKRFLAAASAYRRQVRDRSGLDFSEKALKEQYDHETFGSPRPDPKQNGYTLGKWVLDVTLSSMKEEYHNGMFTKYELMRGSPALVRQQIKKWVAVDPFWV